MKKPIGFLFLVAIILFSSLAGAAQTRIRFARGATSAVVTGTLRGFNSERVYVVRVRRGQRLRVEQIGSTHPVTTTLTDPAGEDASDMDASCNSRKDHSPTKRGDYRITVVECRKADRWRGRFRLRVRVTG
jgi:hypothetical protein